MFIIFISQIPKNFVQDLLCQHFVEHKNIWAKVDGKYIIIFGLLD